MSMPIAKVDLLLGYGIAFGLLAAVQAMVVCATGSLRWPELPPRCVAVGLLAVCNACSGWRLACSRARSRGPNSRRCRSCRR